LSTHLRLGLPSGLLPSGLLRKRMLISQQRCGFYKPIRCRGNVPSEPLLSNGCPSAVGSVNWGKCLQNRCLAMDVSAVLLWLQTSGVQASCVSTLLRLLTKWLYLMAKS
jgi:hypothetical protein